MPHINSNRRKPATTATVVLALLLACLGLAACGGSSNSSTTNASATTSPTGSATGTTGTTSTGATGTGATGARGGRFKALRECLQKDGITLPKQTPGQRRPGGAGGVGGFLGGGAGPQLPKGVTRAQYEAALKKCGGGAFAGRRGRGRLNNPTYKAGLTKFAACMRENGVNVPTPNTSGNGPIFDTKGLNTASAQFRAAESKCIEDLRSASRHGVAPGAAPPGGPSTG